jgi:hypothetical protein
MTIDSVILIWLILIVVFGIYWHVMRISQKMTRCLTLLEKRAEDVKKQIPAWTRTKSFCTTRQIVGSLP